MDSLARSLLSSQNIGLTTPLEVATCLFMSATAMKNFLQEAAFQIWQYPTIQKNILPTIKLSVVLTHPRMERIHPQKWIELQALGEEASGQSILLIAPSLWGKAKQCM